MEVTSYNDKNSIWAWVYNIKVKLCIYLSKQCDSFLKVIILLVNFLTHLNDKKNSTQYIEPSFPLLFNTIYSPQTVQKVHLTNTEDIEIAPDLYTLLIN